MKWLKRQLAKLSNEPVWRVSYFGMQNTYGWITYDQAKELMNNFPMGTLEWKGDTK